jgi:uncharacterized membrane protein YvlD (DUF360 family)
MSKQSSTFSAYQKLVIFLLAVTQFTVILDFMVMSPLGDILMKSLSLSPTDFGIAVSAYAFPLNILTLGLVSFIISVLMILLVDSWMKGFNTSGFLSAAVLAIVVTIIKMILDAAFGMEKS